MAEKLLNRPQVTTALEKMGGKGVAKRVRARFGPDIGAPEATSDDSPYGSV